MELSLEQIIAMAVASIAEESECDISKIRVVSFAEVQKSSLTRYIEENGIEYKKYKLGEDCYVKV